MAGGAVAFHDATTVELATFILSIAVVLLAIFACISRRGLQLARRLGLPLSSRFTGSRWTSIIDGDEDEHLFVSGLGLLGGANETPSSDGAGSGGGGGGSSVVRLRVQLSATGAEELQLDTTGLRTVGEVRATVAACYAEEEAAADELERLMVVRCLDEERGLLVSLPGRTPLDSLRRLRELVVQFTAAAQRERQRAGAAEVSSRAVGASVFARRQKAMLTPSGGREPSGGGGAWLQALPRALRWVVGGRRGAEQPPSSELSRRLRRLRASNDNPVGRLSGLAHSRDSIEDKALNGILATRRKKIDEAGEALAGALATSTHGDSDGECHATPSCHTPVCVSPPPAGKSVLVPLQPSPAPPPPPPSSRAVAAAPTPRAACSGSGAGGAAAGTGGEGDGGFLHSSEFAAKLEARRQSIEQAGSLCAPSAARGGGVAGASRSAAGRGAGSSPVSDGMSYLDQLAERIAARASAKAGGHSC